MIYLAAVLVLLWLLVGGYLVFMLIQQRALQQELRNLREQMQNQPRTRE